MVFSSITFLLFFLPPFIVAYRLGGPRFQNFTLLCASIIFYAWGAFSFLPVLLGICVLNYYLVGALDQTQGNKRKHMLIASILLNAGLLLYFKYANFIVENLYLESLGMHWTAVALPIGISFFSFQSMSYSIDVFRKRAQPLDKLSEYMVYILSFPQMIAGPIVRFTDVENEIRTRTVLSEDFLNGFYRFALGLSKKVLIANTLASIFPLDQLSEVGVEGWSSPQAFVAILGYTFQIYFDFSGYSDMAIGLGSMMGFKFPENFKQPYRAISITDFWRRWHITLSSWMRDYLYIPLGGNRVGSNARLYTNLLVVFAVSGIWHGASWNFLLWGLYHGAFLILDRLFLKEALGRMPAFVARIVTFAFVVIGWVFFAIEDFSVATDYLSLLFSPNLLDTSAYAQLFSNLNSQQILVLLASVFFASTAFYDRLKLPTNKPFTLAFVGLGLWVLSTCYLAGSDFNPFIYFRF